jgi:ribosomal protein S12 methylthiotransferase
LRELVKVDVKWIRLHYAYPRVFTDELIEVMATEPKIAKYLDMPLQHASDKLLKSMKRGRDSSFLKTLLAKIRARVPGLTFRTSLIVGLPGETEEDFELLKAFVKELRFERLGVFQYSDEPGTGAYEMENKVPQKTIERRWREVMAVQKRIAREQNKKLVGQRLEVLVEGVSPESEHLLVGRHEGQAPDIDGQVFINEGLAYPGELVTVEVTQAHDYDLVGKVVARADPKSRKHAPRGAVPAAVRGGEKIITPPTWLAPR